MPDRRCPQELCPNWPGEGCVRGVADCPPMESACRRGCLPDECYHGEPFYSEMNDMCTSCGGTGECYCGEE